MTDQRLTEKGVEGGKGQETGTGLGVEADLQEEGGEPKVEAVVGQEIGEGKDLDQGLEVTERKSQE